MKKRHVPTAFAAVVLAAGCGSSESDFRERAQAVCANYNQQIEGIGNPRDLDELAETSGRIAALITKQVGELRELDAPGDMADDYERWLRLTTEAIANANAIQKAADAGEPQRVNELAGEAARNTLSADRLARDLQIPACMVEPPKSD